MTNLNHPTDQDMLAAREYIGRHNIITVDEIDTTNYTTIAEVSSAYSGLTVSALIAGTLGSAGVIFNIDIASPNVAYVKIRVESRTATSGLVSSPLVVTQGTGSDSWRWDGVRWESFAIGRDFERYSAFNGLNPTTTGQWYDLCTWAGQVTAVGGFSASLGVRLNNDLQNLEQFNVEMLCGYGALEGTLSIKERQSSWGFGEGVDIRLIYDTSDNLGPSRLQLFIKSAFTIQGILINQAVDEHPENGTWGVVDPYTETGSEVVIVEQKMTDWPDRVSRSFTGSIRTDAVVHPDAQTGLTLNHDDVRLLVGDHPNLIASPTGLQIGAGEFDTWMYNTVATPFEGGDAFPALQAPKRTDPNDTTANPLSTVDFELSDVSTGSGNWAWLNYINPTFLPALGQRMMMATTNDQTTILRARYTGATLGQRLYFEADLFKAVVSNGDDFEVRYGIADGATVANWSLPDGDPIGFYAVSASYVVTAADAAQGTVDLFIVKTPTSTAGTSNRAGLARYGIGVEAIRPAKDETTAFQIDSNHKGAMLPKIILDATSTHNQGAMALDALGRNMPVYHDGEAWAYATVLRPLLAEASYGTFISSTGGNPSQQGFSGSFANWPKEVTEVNGFPTLILFPNTGESPGVGTINMISDVFDSGATAAWSLARTNGFQMEVRFMYVTGSFHGWNFDPPSGAGFSAGRWVINLQTGVSGAGFFQIRDENSGTLSDEFPASVMHTLTFSYDGNAAHIAKVTLNGTEIMESTFGGFDGGAGFFVYDNDSANREIYYENFALYVMSAASQNSVINRHAMETGAIFVAQANISTVQIPKGPFPFVSKMYIGNGGTANLRIKGEDDNNIVLGGNGIFTDIPPGGLGMIVNVAYPEGTKWAVIGAAVQSTPHTEGNRLVLNVSGAGLIEGRHGTYTPDDVTISRIQAGEYQINVGAHAFPDTALVQAGARGPGVACLVDGEIAIGTPMVNTYDLTGTRADHDFSVIIEW